MKTHLNPVGLDLCLMEFALDERRGKLLFQLLCVLFFLHTRLNHLLLELLSDKIWSIKV